MSTKTFSVLKSNVSDEATALQEICERENLNANQLVVNHDEEFYRWNLEVENTPIDEQATNQNDWKVYQKDQLTEEEAIAQAITDFESFEGNLKTNHTETEFRFEKIRG